MQLTFYGVRGSVPAPGAEFAKYGGNTACVHIELKDQTQIILDAGTGIKALGHKLLSSQQDIHLLLSHNHWDHIQGFPFFAPIYQANRKILITPGMTNYDEFDAILKQMSGSYFPVHYKDLESDIVLQSVSEDTMDWFIASAHVCRHKMNHPGSGSSYLIEADGAKIAYITDNELNPPYQKQTDIAEWISFAQGADLLIHDAQYLPADMPAKLGWGHSIAEEAVNLALKCNVKKLALYSHDHIRTDDEIDNIESHCRQLVAESGSNINVFAAQEGMTLSF